MSEYLSPKTAIIIYLIVIPLIIYTSLQNRIMIMFWGFWVFIISAYYLYKDMRGGTKT